MAIKRTLLKDLSQMMKKERIDKSNEQLGKDPICLIILIYLITLAIFLQLQMKILKKIIINQQFHLKFMMNLITLTKLITLAIFLQL